MNKKGLAVLLAAAAFIAPSTASAQYTGWSLQGPGGVVAPGETTTVTIMSETYPGPVSGVTAGLDATSSDPTGAVVKLSHNGTTVTLLQNRCLAKPKWRFYVSDSAKIAHDSYPTQNVCKEADSTLFAFRPVEPLSAFTGMNSGGDWKITVTNTGTAPISFSYTTLSVSLDPPNWTIGEWGPWSQTCGVGTRTRKVTCTTSGGHPVDDSHCTPRGAKPTTFERTSQTSGCNYSWQTGAWQGDGSSCGTTTRTRTVKCVQTTANGTVDQPDSSCSGVTKPSTYESVVDYANCRYGWHQTGYQLSTCDGSTQTYRTSFSCFRSDGSIVSGACGYTPPSRTMTQSCEYWQANIGQDFGYAEPRRPLAPSEYSRSGVNNGVGFVSKSGESGVLGYRSGYWSGTAPIARTGGSYDAARDLYSVGGATYTGGNYDSTNGTYYGGTNVQGEGGQGDGSPSAGPSVGDVVMRRPLGNRF